MKQQEGRRNNHILGGRGSSIEGSRFLWWPSKIYFFYRLKMTCTPKLSPNSHKISHANPMIVEMPSKSKNYCGFLADKFSKCLPRYYEISRWEMFQSCWKCSDLWYAPALIIYALIFGINYNISKQTFDALKNSLPVEILWKYLTTLHLNPATSLFLHKLYSSVTLSSFQLLHYLLKS